MSAAWNDLEPLSSSESPCFLQIGDRGLMATQNPRAFPEAPKAQFLAPMKFKISVSPVISP